jgi:hypothetical protein
MEMTIIPPPVSPLTFRGKTVKILFQSIVFCVLNYNESLTPFKFLLKWSISIIWIMWLEYNLKLFYQSSPRQLLHYIIIFLISRLLMKFYIQGLSRNCIRWIVKCYWSFFLFLYLEATAAVILTMFIWHSLESFFSRWRKLLAEERERVKEWNNKLLKI